jgi:hypothetical protein
MVMQGQMVAAILMPQPSKATPKPQGGLVQVTERNCSNVSIFFTPKETKPIFSLMKKRKASHAKHSM